MTDHPELLPCPFCGQMPKIDPIDDGFHMIICESEMCGMQPGVAGNLAPAIAAWNTRADRWIPVSERLPENYQQVLVVDEDKRYFLLWRDVVLGIWCDWQGRQDVRVTHWQLPALPEEVK